MSENIVIKSVNAQELERMMQEEYADRKTFKLEEFNLAPLRRYIDHKIPPGGFLQAILCNDLKEAMGRADGSNRRRVFEYVEWLYNFAPASCWGSPEKYRAWLNEASE